MGRSQLSSLVLLPDPIPIPKASPPKLEPLKEGSQMCFGKWHCEGTGEFVFLDPSTLDLFTRKTYQVGMFSSGPLWYCFLFPGVCL